MKSINKKIGNSRKESIKLLLKEYGAKDKLYDFSACVPEGGWVDYIGAQGSGFIILEIVCAFNFECIDCHIDIGFNQNNMHIKDLFFSVEYFFT